MSYQMSIHETHYSDQYLKHLQHSGSPLTLPNLLASTPRDDQGPGFRSYHTLASEIILLPGFELLKNRIIQHIILFFFLFSIM